MPRGRLQAGGSHCDAGKLSPANLESERLMSSCGFMIFDGGAMGAVPRVGEGRVFSLLLLPGNKSDE